MYILSFIVQGDEGDKLFKKDGPTSVIWAVGKYNSFKEPRMHYLYPKGSIQINFGRKPAAKNCFHFLTFESDSNMLLHPSKKKSWGPLRVLNQTLTTFYARIGVSGGLKGYFSAAESSATPGYVWYINGLMAPVLYVKRGRTYTFRIEGGNNPHDALFYHPLYITDDPAGGFIKHTEERRKSIHIYAGIEFDRKGRPSPVASGRLCHWSYPTGRDARKSDNYLTFIQFRDSLKYKCDQGSPAILKWTPNASIPDLVYYQSYTQRNMGGKIFVLDDFSLISTITSSAFNSKSFSNFYSLIIAFICSFIFKIYKLYIN